MQHDVKTTGEVAVAAKVTPDIDTDVAKFKTSFDQLSAKGKSQPAAQRAYSSNSSKT